MFKERVIAALVLMPIVLAAIFYLPPIAFRVFVGVFIVLALWEWSAFVTEDRNRRIGWLVLSVGLMVVMDFLAFAWLNMVAIVWWCVALGLVVSYPTTSKLWARPVTISVAGWLTLIPSWLGLATMQEMTNGPQLIVGLMFLVWGADTAAYFAGKQWGRRKLAPQVSPGKTIAGLVGALVGSGVIAIIFAVALFEQNVWPAFLLLTFVTVLASILGDLLESMFKRQSGLKDSGSLIPGHGGVLDRIDSLSAAIPVFASGVLAVMA